MGLDEKKTTTILFFKIIQEKELISRIFENVGYISLEVVKENVRLDKVQGEMSSRYLITRVKKYWQIKDPRWMIKHRYDALLKYKLKRGETMGFSTKRVEYLIEFCKDTEVFDIVYRDNKRLFSSDGFLSIAARAGNLHAFKVLESQNDPIKLTVPPSTLEFAMESARIEMIEYIATRYPKQRYAILAIGNVESKYNIDPIHIEQLINLFLENTFDDSDFSVRDRLAWIQDSMIDPSFVKYISVDTARLMARRKDLTMLISPILLAKLIHEMLHMDPNKFEKQVRYPDDMVQILNILTLGAIPFSMQVDAHKLAHDHVDKFVSTTDKRITPFHRFLLRLLAFIPHLQFSCDHDRFGSVVDLLIGETKSCEVASFLLDFEQHYFCDEHVFDVLCNKGSLEMVKFAHNIIGTRSDPSRASFRAASYAARRSDDEAVQVVQFLFENRKEQCSELVLDEVYRADVVDYILTTKPDMIELFSMQFAVASSRLPVIQAFERYYALHPPADPKKLSIYIPRLLVDSILSSMNACCAQDRVYIIRHLFTRYRADVEGSIHHFFSQACTENYLEVVECLCEFVPATTNVKPPSSRKTTIFDEAYLNNGMSSVVKYLIANRKEGFGLESAITVSRYGSTADFDLIFANLGKEFSYLSHAIAEAVRYGNILLIQHIYRKYNIILTLDTVEQVVNPMLLETAVRHDAREVVTFYLSLKPSPEVVQSLLYFALIATRMEIADTVKSLMPVSGKYSCLTPKQINNLIYLEDMTVLLYLDKYNMIPADLSLDARFHLFHHHFSNEVYEFLKSKGFTNIKPQPTDEDSQLAIGDWMLKSCHSIRKRVSMVGTDHDVKTKNDVILQVIKNKYLLNKILRDGWRDQYTQQLRYRMFNRLDQLLQIHHERQSIRSMIILKMQRNELVFTQGMVKDVCATYDLDLLQRIIANYPHFFTSPHLLKHAVNTDNVKVLNVLMTQLNGLEFDSFPLVDGVHAPKCQNYLRVHRPNLLPSTRDMIGDKADMFLEKYWNIHPDKHPTSNGFFHSIKDSLEFLPSLLDRWEYIIGGGLDDEDPDVPSGEPHDDVDIILVNELRYLVQTRPDLFKKGITQLQMVIDDNEWTSVVTYMLTYHPIVNFVDFNYEMGSGRMQPLQVLHDSESIHINTLKEQLREDQGEQEEDLFLERDWPEEFGVQLLSDLKWLMHIRRVVSIEDQVTMSASLGATDSVDWLLFNLLQPQNVINPDAFQPSTYETLKLLCICSPTIHVPQELDDFDFSVEMCKLLLFMGVKPIDAFGISSQVFNPAEIEVVQFIVDYASKNLNYREVVEVIAKIKPNICYGLETNKIITNLYKRNKRKPNTQDFITNLMDGAGIRVPTPSSILTIDYVDYIFDTFDVNFQQHNIILSHFIVGRNNPAIIHFLEFDSDEYKYSVVHDLLAYLFRKSNNTLQIYKYLLENSGDTQTPEALQLIGRYNDMDKFKMQFENYGLMKGDGWTDRQIFEARSVLCQLILVGGAWWFIQDVERYLRQHGDTTLRQYIDSMKLMTASVLGVGEESDKNIPNVFKYQTFSPYNATIEPLKWFLEFTGDDEQGTRKRLFFRDSILLNRVELASYLYSQLDKCLGGVPTTKFEWERTLQMDPVTINYLFSINLFNLETLPEWIQNLETIGYSPLAIFLKSKQIKDLKRKV